MRFKALLTAAAIILPLAATLPLTRVQASSEPVKIEAPKLDAVAADSLQTAVIAGGCFWGVQAVYQHTKGVTKALSGYAGGDKKDADYDRVSAGRTQPCRGCAGDVRPEGDLLRQDPANLLLGGARPDPAQSPGPGHRPALPHRDFPAERGAGEGRQGVCRAARRREGVCKADRNQDRHDEGRVLSGRGVSSGLRVPESEQACTSSSTTRRRWRTSRSSSRRSFGRSRCWWRM